MNEIDIVIELSKWYPDRIEELIISSINMIDVSSWCEKRLGKESIENGWLLTYRIGQFQVIFRDKKIFTEFVLTWG